MSDAELVKRLRELRNNQYADPSTAPEFVFLDPDLPPSEWEKQYSMDVVYVRADRIEALTEQLKTVLDREAATTARYDSKLEALTEQLEAARADAKEAEAYAEELEKRVAFVEEERRKTFQALLKVTKIHDDVEAKLAKAVEALDYCINAPFSGWTIAQGYARATLAEIEGEQT